MEFPEELVTERRVGGGDIGVSKLNSSGGPLDDYGLTILTLVRLLVTIRPWNLSYYRVFDVRTKQRGQTPVDL